MDEIASLTSTDLKAQTGSSLASRANAMPSIRVKFFSKNPNISELEIKLKMQWKIEHCSLT